jgi:hypothetical protein
MVADWSPRIIPIRADLPRRGAREGRETLTDPLVPARCKTIKRAA